MAVAMLANNITVRVPSTTTASAGGAAAKEKSITAVKITINLFIFLIVTPPLCFDKCLFYLKARLISSAYFICHNVSQNMVTETEMSILTIRHAEQLFGSCCHTIWVYYDFQYSVRLIEPNLNC